MISGKAVSKSIDANGNIIVSSEYTLTDGSKIQGQTRYTSFNFSADAVLKDIKQHCETLMYKTYNLKQNQTKINDVDLSKISYDCMSAEYVVKPEIKTGETITQAKEAITMTDA